ncbi:MAG: restriction endonuclease subunit S [Anaerolineaceae bacterium]
MLDRISLNDVDWKEFKIKDLFDVTNSKAYHKESLESHSIGVPYVSRTSLNNGLIDIVSMNDEFIINEANAISLGAENADFFFQSVDYITGNKMYRIANKHVNKNIGLFLVQVFRSSLKGCDFGYGVGLTGTRFKNRTILLPVDDEGNPNWQFMEDYIKQEQKVIAHNVIHYYEQKIVETGFDLDKVENLSWKVFIVNEVFKVETVGGKTKSNYDEGQIPYVTTSSQNNGVNGFVRSTKNISPQKAISVDPIAGRAFYHDYDFIGRGGAGSAISLLYNKNLDKYNAQFICVMIEKVSKEKASYGLALNGDRLKNTKFFLPSDRLGNPHWEYMSQFMRKIEVEKIERALEYLTIYLN